MTKCLKSETTARKPHRWHRRADMRLYLVCVAALTWLLATGCGRKKADVTESIADIQKREGIPVTVITASRMDIEAIERSGGTVEGYQQSVISAGIPATVSAIKVSVGHYVEKDALLMTLKPSAASPYTIAKANAQTVEKSQERAQALARQGGLPQEMLDNIETGVIAARENLEAARKTENILAPFSGTIVDLYPPVNTLVWPGKELVKIASLGRVRVKMSVSEAIIGRFKPGQKAVIRDVDGPISGEVEKVSLAGDESSHAFTVEAVFDNAGRRLRPGMYVAVDVVVDRRPSAVALPLETVIAEGVEKYAYVIEEGVARKRPLTVGIRGGDYYEIVAGVSAGETVVSSGASLLSDGARVKVVQ